VQEICGIGERRAKRLAEHKLFTALDWHWRIANTSALF